MARVVVTAFTEVYRPVRNGVVASIDALRAGAADAGIALTVVAPRFPRRGAADDEKDDDDVLRIPSIPLPTATAYRLCVPILGAAVRAAVARSQVVHAHSPFVTGVLAARCARRAGLPLVYTYHTRLDEYAHYVPFERALTRRAANAVARAFADRATIVVVPTRAMEVRLREIGVGAPIRVVPSAIDVARFAAGRRSDAVRARLGAGASDRLVLLVSRLGREKNVGLAIEALARIADPRVRLALVGDGPSRSLLEARARELGVAARVAFAGASAPGDLPDIYASADAFAFPSLSETQGLVLAEAMAVGLPIAAIATPVTREVLGGAGRISRGDPERFARGVLAALDAGRDQSAEHLALERFNLRTHAERMAAIYAEARERFD